VDGSCPWAHQTRGAKEHNKNINIFDEPYVENSWPTGSVLKNGKGCPYSITEHAVHHTVL